MPWKNFDCGEVVEDDGGLLVRLPGEEQYHHVRTTARWVGGRLHVEVRPPPGLVTDQYGATDDGRGLLAVFASPEVAGTPRGAPPLRPRCARMEGDGRPGR